MFQLCFSRCASSVLEAPVWRVGALVRGNLVNANQSFYGDMSDGRTRPAQLQDATNRQANDDESADQHTDRGQSAFAGKTGFAHSGTEPSRMVSRSLLHPELHASQLRIPAAVCSSATPRIKKFRDGLVQLLVSQARERVGVWIPAAIFAQSATHHHHAPSSAGT